MYSFNVQSRFNQLNESKIMYQSINFSEFCDAFRRCDRQDQFSYEGKRALFEYIEALEEDTGTPYELDVIALCCEWSESSIADVATEYNIDIDGMDNDDALEAVSDFLRDNTQIAGTTPGGIVYKQF